MVNESKNFYSPGMSPQALAAKVLKDRFGEEMPSIPIDPFKLMREYGIVYQLMEFENLEGIYYSVADEIDRLRELKQNALVESAEREGLKQRIREMREFLEQQSTEVTEYDELLVRRLIEKVTVYDERFEVEFKSGAKVDVGR